MPTTSSSPIKFGPFEVTDQASPIPSPDIHHLFLFNPSNTLQVFHKTTHSYALVNIKPLLPGHILIVPLRPVARLTDLSPAETADLFTLVQRAQRMLASVYFPSPSRPEEGSFNIAIQDGVEAGQSVPHLHCHIIPRIGDGKGDGIYGELAGEQGNVGGGLWDRYMQKRPEVRGEEFPKIEDSARLPRSMEEMVAEARRFEDAMKQF